jgi:hypothetical protein
VRFSFAGNPVHCEGGGRPFGRRFAL